MASSRALRPQDDLDAAVLLVAEHLVHLRPVLERNGVGDDEGRIDLTFFDAAQEIVGPAVDVSLAHAEGEALVHRLTHRDFVDEAAINARNRDHAGGAADIDHLAQDMRAIVLHHHHLLGAVEQRIGLRQRDMALQARRIDALVGAFAAGELVQALDDALLLEIDCDGAAGFRHSEPLRQHVDGNDLFGAEQDRAADRHLADRTAAPDRDNIGRLDVALNGGLPSRRENVAEEENLLVSETVRHFDVRRIGEGDAKIFRLSAGITAGQMRVAEEASGRVPEDFVGKFFVAVRRLADREIAALALLAFAANDRERHDDAVALLQVTVDAGTDLDHLAHHLVSHDVAGQHRGNEIVEEMKVRAADRAARYFDDRITRMLDLGIRNRVAADIFLPMPNKGFHVMASRTRLRSFRSDITDVHSFPAAERYGPGLGSGRGIWARRRRASGECSAWTSPPARLWS